MEDKRPAASLRMTEGSAEDGEEGVSMAHSMAEHIDGPKTWVRSRAVRFSGHMLASVSLLWSTYFWLLFFYINASEEPAGPTDLHNFEISSASLVLAVAGAVLRSRLSWLSIPAAVLTLAVAYDFFRVLSSR